MIRIAAVGVRAARSLRSATHENGWTLAELSELPPPSDVRADVVAVDARDPDATGVLDKIRASRPDLPRLLVRPAQVSIPSARLAHAVIPDEVHPDELRTVVGNIRRLVATIGNDAIRQVAGELQHLPPLPDTYTRILELAERPSTTASQIAQVIETDPAIALRVLQLSNSVSFGATRRISSIAQAVSLLGVEVLAALVASMNAFGAFDIRMRELSLDQFRTFSLLVARLARQLVPSHADEAFAAGLFHDIGKLALAACRPAELAVVLTEPVPGTPPYRHERTLVGCGHPELGGYLLDRWGLPLRIVQAVAYHHSPRECADPSPVLAAVHAADLLLGQVLCGDTEDIDSEFLASVGFGPNLESWRKLAAEVR